MSAKSHSFSTDPSLGVCYYPEHWPEDSWLKDTRDMAAMGLSFVRIGEFAWSRLEPHPDKLSWDWLDRAIETIGKAGLEVILGTPTATPPRWMINKHPDMLAMDAEGRPRKFGSRRHYCFSHKGYREECARIAGLFAERYGSNPYVAAWQIDNEYGCHETTLSYSDHAKIAFQKWLSKKYENIDALNTRWGNVFWSMEYSAFEDIDLPNLMVTEANPAHIMDFRRFASDEVAAFNRVQCAAIRAHSDKPLIHNYMGRITDFDHFDVGADLEIASWDSYPLGFLEDRSDRDEEFKHRFQRQGDPDFQAFHHDLYRAVGKSGWGVMELQPGPVNWAPYNPAPLPGMVRLWSWEAVAHGADFVSYFRWRQAPFAQEQMHAGLNTPDGTPSVVSSEIAQMAQDLKKVSGVKCETAPIAILFDYPSSWAWDIQPQGRDFDYFKLVFDFYRALRKLGQDIDFISLNSTKLAEYKLILIPGLFNAPEQFIQKLKSSGSKLLLGPRSGSKTADFQISSNNLDAIADWYLKIKAVESLRPTEQIEINGPGYIHIWREFVDTDASITLQSKDGHPVLVEHGQTAYLSAWPDEIALEYILTLFLDRLNIPVETMVEGVRVRNRGRYQIYINYSSQSQTQGSFELPSAGVRLIDRETGIILIEK